MRKESLTFYVKDLAKAVAWYVHELQRVPSYVVSDEACFSLDDVDLLLIREKNAPAVWEEIRWPAPLTFPRFDHYEGRLFGAFSIP